MHQDLRVGRLIEPLSGRSWETDETREQVARRVAWYLANGLEPGDRVLIHFGNRLEFFAELLAIWACGACAIPVDARLTPFEVERLATVAGPRFAVIDDDTDPAAVRNLQGTTVIPTGETSSADPTGDSPRGTMLDDDALILFTSGSTGSPKGVIHTHRSLRARWATLRQSLGSEPYARTLCVLPTHFGHGLICNCLYPWLSGQDLFVMPPFRQDLLMRLGATIDEHEITFMSSVPAVWRIVLKTSAPPQRGSLKRIHIGSSPLSAAVWREVRRWSSVSDVFNAYGITETGSWVAGTSGDPDFEPEDGLIGRPWGAEVKVLRTRRTDVDLTPELECEPGENGLVWLNTPALMRGYFRRDEVTSEVIRDGWFMTGDIGVQDERGRLYLKGREREEINKAGMKIYPADVDAVIERHRAVTDVCTFGYNDVAYGEEIGIAIVMSDSSVEVLHDLYRWAEAHLAEFKIPKRWYLIDSIPRTSRGKINRETVMQACDSLDPIEWSGLLSAARVG